VGAFSARWLYASRILVGMQGGKMFAMRLNHRPLVLDRARRVLIFPKRQAFYTPIWYEERSRVFDKSSKSLMRMFWLKGIPQ